MSRNQAVSSSGTECSVCDETTGSTYSSDDCSCAQPGTTTDEGSVITNFLQESYNATGHSVKSCVQCPHGKAALTADIFTAGVSYEADPYTCQECPHERMHFDATFECVCETGYSKVGQEYFGPMFCSTDTISSTSYYEVEFKAVQESSSSSSSTTTFDHDSDAIRHYYEWASSLCGSKTYDSVEKLTAEQQRACQTLANLCVMQMYDNDAEVCERYEAIMNSRQGEYVDNWKQGLPWLYYDGEDAQSVRTDRGIQMKVSFEEVVGYSNVLKYKLIKYTLDGQLAGVEDLSTHFSYCGMQSPVTHMGGGASSSTKFLKFGTSERTSFHCDLELLETETMYFYELFLVDESTSVDCANQQDADGNCLYPVPVLVRNLIENGAKPNENSDESMEFDDVFVRRFVLFDNQAGSTATDTGTQVEVLRFAKTIILENKIRTEDPTKLFPPTLTIEYAERQTSSWSNREDDTDAAKMAVSRILFKSEYTMDTTNFWSSIDVLIGFVSAGAIALWIGRTFNWYSRNRRPGYVDPDANTTRDMVHIIMLAVHSFVHVFFPFIFFLCAYWFVFFKLQETVFVMLPANNEYYLTNEYYFFESFFHVLFWTHTVYILYVIYCQCTTDIFFVDWEKPKTSKQDVSIWRTLMVANEWNEMQTMRKTSIEFSLVWIGFFLIGLDLQNNDTMNPDSDDLDDGYSNMVLRFCNTTWWFFVTYAVQWLWRFVFYERYYREPRSQIFVDLCTMAKVSVFIMDEPFHGYYLHCRSPYEFADGSMMQLAEQLKKEENGLTTDRGLDAPGAPRDCQTFELFTSQTFRGQFDKVYSALHQNSSAALAQDTMRLGHMVGRAGGKGRAPPPERMVSALKELNSFLQSFVEQSPPPQSEELKRIVREPTLCDRFLRIPPSDVQQSNGKCVFYPDQKSWLKDNNFLAVTFLGIEADLWVNNVLCFNMFDMGFDNPAISIVGTYLLHLFYVWLRGSFGQGNLASKTLVDDRFLL